MTFTFSLMFCSAAAATLAYICGLAVGVERGKRLPRRHPGDAP